MPKTCDLVPLCPPFNPCSCAHKCDCECHGKLSTRTRKMVPNDPDAFNTTSRSFHGAPNPDDYNSGKKYKPTDNLGRDPNLIPLGTEYTRQYTPKTAERDPKARQRAWNYGQPLDARTMNGDAYKAPSEDDYPTRTRAFAKPQRTQPGSYDTTYRQAYIKPDEDMYSAPDGGGVPATKRSLPGLYGTEYRDNYLGNPTDRSMPYKPSTMQLGTRPSDFSTTNTRSFKPPAEDEYPTRERGYKKGPDQTGPLGRLESTHREDYRDPGLPEDDLKRERPRDSNFLHGPNCPFSSTYRDQYGPKSHFCCGCSSH
ncbi:hypothetical protein BLNAU_15044 [Blattamonas nauphoetae]|uniref:Uncharacterized protein n=1 Tax=Blattamonas nauphoetae TaxID=2049346 RepID=A0ABQ9XF19_9EUKA|nr:hypothetical protein BLNAU_15044 [Blattamonas nauphoetae]